MTFSEILAKDTCFRYQLLSRMKADCEYYLGCGNRCRKYLWADDEEEQIALMKALWRSFSEKPEWLSWDEILEYERKMCPNPERQNAASFSDALARTLEAVLDEQGEVSILLYRPAQGKAGGDLLLDGNASVCPKRGQEPRHEGRVICDASYLGGLPVGPPGTGAVMLIGLPQYSFGLRTFECPECGLQLTAPRGRPAAMLNENRKSLYCPRCKADREFVRVPMEMA